MLTGLTGLGRAPADLPALGFLPAGTANSAARAFGFTSDPSAMARALPGAEIRRVDVAMARFGQGERPFLLWCGAGYDAVVIEELNAARTGLMGLARTAPRVLRALVRYPAPAIRLRVDADRVADASSVILANVAEMAFGGAVASKADPFDGEIDVVAIDPAPPLRILGLGLRLLARGLGSASGARRFLATDAHLDSDGVVPAQLDGEPAGTLPVSVRVVPGAVRLLMT